MIAISQQNDVANWKEKTASTNSLSSIWLRSDILYVCIGLCLPMESRISAAMKLKCSCCCARDRLWSNQRRCFVRDCAKENDAGCELAIYIRQATNSRRMSVLVGAGDDNRGATHILFYRQPWLTMTASADAVARAQKSLLCAAFSTDNFRCLFTGLLPRWHARFCVTFCWPHTEPAYRAVACDRRPRARLANCDRRLSRQFANRHARIKCQ